MTSQVSLAVVGLVLAMTTQAMAYDSALYEDMLFQDLYKRLTQMDNVYYPADDSYSDQALYEPIIPMDSRDSGQTNIRDPEFLAPSSNSDGFQYISGGAGEGKQHLKPEGTLENTQEVKSDDVLPFYCHPPNPCPKGFTEEDGCQMGVPDTAEDQKDWITQMQDKGMCTCDEEHMFDCMQKPGGDDAGSMMGEEPETEELNDFINTILGDKSKTKDYSKYHKNPYVTGNHIDGRVAKKSPRMRRSIENIEQQLKRLQMKKDSNPYLQGDNIHIVAKKGFHVKGNNY